MRFSRRKETRRPAVRRDAVTTGRDLGGPVASEERSALLFRDTEASTNSTEAQTPNARPSSVSTQALMNALGRFHRFAAKGEAGAPQELWTDDCMNHLVDAVEIAIGNNWKYIARALTDTARILHSYEKAGCAQLAVPFLNDSYKILCLMVGDLIVNNTSTGLESRWNDRYNKAVVALLDAGLKLIDDEPSEDAAPAESAPEPPVAKAPDAPVATAKPKQGEVLPFTRPEPAAVRRAPEPRPEPKPEVPKMDDFLPFPEAFDEEEEEEESSAPTVREALPESVFEPVEPAPEPVAAPPTPAAAAVFEPVAEVPEEAAIEDADTAVYEDAVDEVEDVEEVQGTTVTDILDALCEDLAQIEGAAVDARAPLFDLIEEKLGELERFARGDGHDKALLTCERMRTICGVAAQARGRIDDRFFESAYAFCEAYMAAGRDGKDALADTWRRESEALTTSVPEAPSETPKAIVEEVPAVDAFAAETGAEEAAEEGSPDSLLETARQAIVRGDMGSAKALALQAVVHLAEAEAAKAQARVEEAERRFSANAEEIEFARASVKKCEQEVTVAEGRVAEGQAELADARAHVSMNAEKVAGIEKRVHEIEDQIRALQEARQRELDRVNEARGELDAAQAEEERTADDVATMSEAEQAARSGLEKARQNVKDLQRRRLELEELLSRARETLTYHRQSLSDVERTIVQLRSSDGQPSGEEGELLF